MYFTVKNYLNNTYLKVYVLVNYAFKACVTMGFGRGRRGTNPPEK